MTADRVLRVLPTRAHVDDATREVLARDGVALGLGVVGFGELRRRLLYVAGLDPIDRLHTELLAADRLHLSGRRARAFVRLWDTLREAGLTIDRLRRVERRSEQTGGGGRMASFVQLAEGYQRALRALGRPDEAMAAGALAGRIDGLGASELGSAVEGAAAIVIDGSIDITVARARWLDALARRGHGVTVIMNSSSMARPGLDIARRNLEDHAPHVRVEDARRAEGAGAAVERRIALGESRADPAVRLVEVDTEEEARRWVRVLVERHLAGGQGRMAIVDPLVAAHADAWARTFGDLFVDDRRGRALSDTIAGRGVLGLVDTWRHHLERERLCDWLEGPWSVNLVEHGFASRLRSALRAAGSRDGRGVGHIGRLRALGQAPATTIADEFEAVLTRIAWPSEATFEHHATIAADHVRSWATHPVHLGLDRSSGPAIEGVRERQAGMRAVLERLEQLGEAARGVGTSRMLTRDDIARTLADDLSAERLPRARVRRGVVALVAPDDVAGRRFETVVVVGLVDGTFPRTSSDDGFLDADDRRALEVASGRPVFRRARAHDELRFSELLAAAEQRVHAVVPRVDARGVPVSARSFFDALAGAVEGQIDRGAVAVHDDGPGRWGLPDGQPAAPAHVSGRIERTRAAVRGRLGIDMSARLRWTTSASALERYATCPYRFFVERVLGVGETDDSDELGARGIGELGHEAFAAMFVALRKRDYLPLQGGARARGEDSVSLAAVRATIDRWRAGQPVGVRPFFELEGERLMRSALALIAVERARGRERWVPRAFEQAFGGESSLELSDPGEGDAVVRVRGRVDRVDERSDGERRELLVIDYKRGRVAQRVRGRELGRTSLQLPLYVAWARERLAQSGDVPTTVDGQLVSLDDGRRSHSTVRGCMAREPGLRDLLEPSVAPDGDHANLQMAVGAADVPALDQSRSVAETAWAYTRGIAAGRFDPRPVRGAETCAHCPHGSICRVGERQDGEER